MDINLSYPFYFWKSAFVSLGKKFLQGFAVIFNIEWYFEWIAFLLNRMNKFYFKINLFPILNIQNKGPFKNSFQFGYL